MVAKLINHVGSGNSCYEMPPIMEMYDEMTDVIFQNGKDSSHSKNLHKNITIWFKLFIGCIHHRPCTTSSDYVNTNQKYMLFFLAFGIRLNLPVILIKYLVEIIKETIDTFSKQRKWIPMGRLVYFILVEIKLMESLVLSKELEVKFGISLDDRNMKNMALIQEVTVLPDPIDMNFVISKRLVIEHFPTFDSLEFPKSIQKITNTEN